MCSAPVRGVCLLSACTAWSQPPTATSSSALSAALKVNTSPLCFWRPTAATACAYGELKIPHGDLSLRS